MLWRRITLRRLAIWLTLAFAILILVLAVGLLAGRRWLQRNPQFAEKADRVQAMAAYYSLKWTSSYVREGEQSYNIHCAACHGKDGSGGRGSNLRASPVVLASSPNPLYSIIRIGRVSRGMPLFPPALMPTDEAYKLVAYVRKMSADAPPERVPGDARKGEAIFRGKGGCTACHVSGTEPATGFVTFDLSGIGGRRSVAFLRESLLDPDAYLGPSHRPVSVVTNAGEKTSGVVIREDTFHLLLRDSASAIHSFDKTQLRSVTSPKQSLMPSYRDSFSGAELDDLLAYLVSLR